MKVTAIWFLAIWFLLTIGTAALAGPELAVDPPSLDWGTISPGERIERQFSLINTGDADLVIEAVSTSCHCLSASLAAKVLSPGETAVLRVVFDATRESGSFLGFVILRTNDPLRPVRRIEIKGRIDEQTPGDRKMETERPQEGEGGPTEKGVFLRREASPSASPAAGGKKEEPRPILSPSVRVEKEKATKGRSRLLFFYSSHCRDCLAVKDRFLPAFLRRHPGAEIVSYDLDTAKGYLALLGAEESLGRPIAAAPPFMIIGRRLLRGREEIEKYAEEALGQGQTTAMPAPVGAEKAAAGFRRLRLSAVVLGGLLDGLNPCAFAILVFLLSYLLFVGEGRRLVPVGLGFAAGVFAGYLAIGLGLLELVGRLQTLPVLHRIFRLGLAAALFLFGLAGLRDAWLLQRGRTREAALQLPEGLKRRIHAVIRERMKGRVGIGGSLAIGLLVAFFEFPCTGQVYFPVVAVLREGGAARSTALGYLLLYNLLFITPLFVLILLVRLGTSSTRLAAMARRQAAGVRLLLALFSFLLAGILLASGIR